jgi:hypothetical protein
MSSKKRTYKRADSSRRQTRARTRKADDETLLSSLTCSVCTADLARPFMACENGHVQCNECQPRLDCCPICRVTPAGSTRELALEAAAATLVVPCANGCGESVPFYARGDHEQGACRLAPARCPMRGAICYTIEGGWETHDACDCRGLATTQDLVAHLLQHQEPETKQPSISTFSSDTPGGRSWTFALPEAWAGAANADTWEATTASGRTRYSIALLTTDDGHKMLLSFRVSPLVGVVVLAIGLSPDSETLRIRARMQQEGGGGGYSCRWRGRVVPVSALRPAAPAAEVAAVLDRSVAFPFAALRLCTVGPNPVCRVRLVGADEDSDDSGSDADAGEYPESFDDEDYDSGHERYDGESDDDEYGRRRQWCVDCWEWHYGHEEDEEEEDEDGPSRTPRRT